MPGRLLGRRLAFGVAAIAVLLLAAYLAIPPLSRTAAFRDAAERLATRLAGYPIRIGDVRIGYDLSVLATDVSLRAGESEPFASVDELRLTPRPGFDLGASLAEIDLRGAHLYVDRLPARGADTAVTEPGEAPRVAPPAPSLRLPPLRLRLDDAYVHRGTSTIGPIDLETAASGADGLALSGTSRLGAGNELHWNAALSPGEAAASVEARGSLDDLPAAARSLGIEPGEELAGGIGELRLQARSAYGENDALETKGEVSVDGLQLHDDDYSTVVQKASARAKIAAVLGADGALSATVEASVPAGEALWDRFYVDLGKHPVRLTLGASTKGGREIGLRDVDVDAGGLARIQGRATYDLGSGGGRFEARLSADDVGPLYRVAVREPFRQSYPVLDRTVVRGSLGARLAYRDGGAPRIEADLSLDGVVVESEGSLSLRGLHVDLPVRIGGAPGGEATPGSLRAAEVEVGGVTVDRLSLDLAAARNRVFLRNPVRIPLLGGVVELGAFSAEELESPGRRARMTLSLRDLRLRDLSAALGWPPFEGTISGAAHDVTIAQDRIASDGVIEANVFDGTVWVRNFRIEQILSPVPETSFDLEFRDISLARLTGAFDVGGISGVVQGAVEDLVIVAGQPVHFDAWMETVDRPGVRQKISVTALQQLSILGGSGGDALTRGLLGLFDEYGYKKLGFRCQLRNDRFLLHGVERAEGKEFLVVGSFLPPRVNVVSHTQVISFSEMLKRLKRALEAGGAAASVE